MNVRQSSRTYQVVFLAHTQKRPPSDPSVYVYSCPIRPYRACINLDNKDLMAEWWVSLLGQNKSGPPRKETQGSILREELLCSLLLQNFCRHVTPSVKWLGRLANRYIYQTQLTSLSIVSSSSSIFSSL